MMSAGKVGTAAAEPLQTAGQVGHLFLLFLNWVKLFGAQQRVVG